MLRRHVDEGNTIRIVTHNDADGVAAGGILSQTVRRLGTPFKTTCEKRVDEKMVRAVTEGILEVPSRLQERAVEIVRFERLPGDGSRQGKEQNDGEHCSVTFHDSPP